MVDKWQTLTWEQRQFLGKRLLCGTDKEAAEACGLNRKTPGNWKLESPLFLEAYEKLPSDGMDFAKDTLRQLLGRATLVHAQLLDDPDAKVQLGAVKLLYEAQGLIVKKNEHSGPGGSILRIVIEDGSGESPDN